jgi:asparagine synthase (glutamine-hydrolysing)
MCGICGFFETSGARLSRRDLERATDTIAHRGPDAVGYAMAEHGRPPADHLPDAPVGLGHRRLSILDLSAAANQPMLFDDSRIAVVFNGEIFNYRELQAEHFADRRARTTSDTELIGWAYQRWGADCFRHFNGFFAIAIYDAAQDCLLLARDRLGKKPLFYWQHGGHFAFGSELKALFAHPQMTRALDRSALDDYLALSYVPGERCLLADCHKLPAGSWLRLDRAGNITIQRYWDILEIAARTTDTPRPEAECLAELDRLLLDATRLRLISDVPLGAFLSGGVDSSLVAATMCRLGGRPRTFTIAFDDPRYDESRYARAVAQHLGTEHTELVATPAHARELVHALPRMYDEPFADPSALPTALLAQLTRQHVTVALSGDGGDELFFGYNRYAHAVDFARVARMPAALRRSAGAVLSRLGATAAKYGAYLREPDAAAFFVRNSSIFTPEELTALHGTPAARENDLAAAMRRLADAPLYRRMRAAEIRTYLGDGILQKVDRATMAVALEARAPLLDHRLVEFALSLPLALLYPRRERKHLLKRLLYRDVPAKLFARPKQGFDLPLDAWFRGELRPLLDQHLAADRLHRQGLFDADFVAALLRRHLSGRTNETRKLFSLLAFQMWYETYLA